MEMSDHISRRLQDAASTAGISVGQLIDALYAFNYSHGTGDGLHGSSAVNANLEQLYNENFSGFPLPNFEPGTYVDTGLGTPSTLRYHQTHIGDQSSSVLLDDPNREQIGIHNTAYHSALHDTESHYNSLPVDFQPQLAQNQSLELCTTGDRAKVPNGSVIAELETQMEDAVTDLIGGQRSTHNQPHAIEPLRVVHLASTGPCSHTWNIRPLVSAILRSFIPPALRLQVRKGRRRRPVDEGNSDPKRNYLRGSNSQGRPRRNRLDTGSWDTGNRRALNSKPCIRCRLQKKKVRISGETRATQVLQLVVHSQSIRSRWSVPYLPCVGAPNSLETAMHTI